MVHADEGRPAGGLPAVEVDRPLRSGEAGRLPAVDAGSGGRVNVLEVNAFSSFNPASASGNTDINSKIAHATRSGFWYLGADLKIVSNHKFGRYEKLTDDPLAVRYTVNAGVEWSDGIAVDAADLLLAWAAGSGYYDDGTPDGRGTKYFTPAAGTSGLGLTAFPDIGDDGRSVTLTYSKPFAEWEIALNIDLPAHVVAVKAGLSGKQALVSLLRQARRGNRRAPTSPDPLLMAVAAAWNTGFDGVGLPADPSLSLSTGPYKVQDIAPGLGLTLVRNPSYAWGPKCALDEISVRFVASTAAQVAGLMDGSADIISPQAAMEGAEELEALSSSGFVVERYDHPGYEHLDLTFSGPFEDKSVREAFLRTVPRRDIANSVLGSIDPGAAPLDSHFFLPGHPAYERVTRDNGSSGYRDTDPQLAIRILGKTSPEVRILYNADNPNRVAAFRLIRAAAEKAGFRIVDGGRGGSGWSRSLGSRDYDAAIFGWAVPEPAASIAGQIYGSGQPDNFNGYSDSDADALIAEMAATAELEKRDELLARLDRRLWDAAYGLPLYRTAGVAAHSASLAGVRADGNVLGLWNSLRDWAWTAERRG